jgi:hypothetical protein
MIAPDRVVTNPLNVRAPARRASANKLALLREQLFVIALKEHPELTEAQATSLANSQLKDLQQRDPDVIKVFDEYAMSSTAPPRRPINPFAEIAATLAQQPISQLLRHLACTPHTRGPKPDLSTAVAIIVDEAIRPSWCVIRHTRHELEAGQLSRRWSLNLPAANPEEWSSYKHIDTVTGTISQRDPERKPTIKPGHDPGHYPRTNIDLLRELAALTDDEGNLCHPRLGRIAILDGTRIRAPISQSPPPSAKYLRMQAGAALAGIAFSVYDHGGQFDSKKGWRPVKLVDQQTGLPLIWTIAPANVEEDKVLIRNLLPNLFRLWPDCPLEIIIGDGVLDNAWVCGELEARWSIHPMFTRRTSKRRTVVVRGGGTYTTNDGQLICSCGTAMTFRGREGFFSYKQRETAGIPRGAMAPNTKEARIRWKCTSCSAKGTTYALKQVGHDWPNANHHLYYPIHGAGGSSLLRKALLLYRNIVESTFAVMKATGVGNEQPAQWAKDHGIVHLIGMYFTLRTARRLAHENGSYAILAAEHATLGLATNTSNPPSLQRMLELRDERPAHLRWAWPPPQRLAPPSD